MVLMTIILASSIMYPFIPQSPPIANLFIGTHNFTDSGDYLIEASSGSGGSISPAGKIYVPASSNVTFSIMPVDNYKVFNVLVDGAPIGPVSTYTFNNVSSNHSIQASFTVDFDVQDNTVVPESNFTVNATVLGSAITNGPNGYNLPVTCRLNLGDYPYIPWGDYTKALDGNLNDGKNPRFWESPISFKAGTPVRVEACSWLKNGGNSAKNSGWSIFHKVDTSNKSFNLKVLKNGDPAPNISGFNNQLSVKDIVTDYIENGSIKLKENEVIYLFELGTKVLVKEPDDPVADFQDLVILVSINGVDTPQSEDASQDVVYPDENSNEIPNKMVTRLVIEHLGGDTINFKSPEETKVILYIGDDQRYLNFTELGVFKVGDSAIVDLKDYYTDEPLKFSQGDHLSIKIVDIPSKSIIYSRSITVK